MNICNASAFSMWVFVFCIACNIHTSVNVWAYVVTCAMYNIIMYVWLGYVMYGWMQGSMGYAEDMFSRCIPSTNRCFILFYVVLWCFVEVQWLVSPRISTLNLVYTCMNIRPTQIVSWSWQNDKILASSLAGGAVLSRLKRSSSHSIKSYWKVQSLHVASNICM